ncbi:hypothetical protein ACIP79_18855 [Streptomyces sp. NPDC088747]|uniref:hypothetical protein n=1 Tax=Streptomyces sp. NPDC088747 TaxID=3365886 RepID=UPI0038214811
MSKKYVRRMLREMESGEPVQLTLGMMTAKGAARLALIAEEFGYAYEDLWQTGDKVVLSVVPDPSPQARERAAQNRQRYPDANEGLSLPPVVPETVELLKARMLFDLTRQFTDRQRVAIAAVVITVSVATCGYRFADSTVGVAIAVSVWAALIVLLPVGIVVRRHYDAKCAAQLDAAGFTMVTDGSGRLRYVPPEGRLPGHGNPFAPEA